MNETNEHNPDGLTPEQYGAPEWRLLTCGETPGIGDEMDVGASGTNWTSVDGNFDTPVETMLLTYRRRVSPTLADQSARIAELERRVEELTEEKEDLQQFKSEVDAEGSVPASRVQLLSNYEHAFRDIGLLLGFDTADTEGTSPEEIAERVNAELSQLRAEVERLKAELAYLKLQRDTLLEITWLDLPDEPHESTKRWRDLFNAGWERKAVSEELRTQLAEREEDRWQPIETAPKDGTPILACLQPHIPAIVQWIRGKWSIDPEEFAAQEHFEEVFKSTIYHPTHWQPLPQPPAIRAARAQDGK